MLLFIQVFLIAPAGVIRVSAAVHAGVIRVSAAVLAGVNVEVPQEFIGWTVRDVLLPFIVRQLYYLIGVGCLP